VSRVLATKCPSDYESHDHLDCSETLPAGCAAFAVVVTDAADAAGEAGGAASLIETLNDSGSVSAAAVFAVGCWYGATPQGQGQKCYYERSHESASSG